MVQPLIKMVYMTGGYLIGRNNVIGESDQAARFAHARHLGDALARIGIVMKRNAVRDQIKGVVVEREGLRIGWLELDIGNTALGGEIACRVEHLWSQVGCYYFSHMRGKHQRRVPGPGRNVKNDPARLGLGEIDETFETRSFGMYFARRVFGGIRAELLLN